MGSFRSLFWQRIFLVPRSRGGAGGRLCAVLHGGGSDGLWQRRRAASDSLPNVFFLFHVVWLSCKPQRWEQPEKTFRAGSVCVGRVWVSIHSCFFFGAVLGFKLSPDPSPRWYKCLPFTPDVFWEQIPIKHGSP